MKLCYSIEMNDPALDINAMPHILVVDDDERLRDLLLRYLSAQGCLVMTAESAAIADGMLKRFEYDLLVVDVMMPGEDGISLTRRLKQQFPHTPILMLTAKAETEYRIEGLEAGVDDYLSKPFEPRELWLRLQAILRRTLKTQPGVTKQIGDWYFDQDRRRLKSEDAADITLTETETALLALLMTKSGQVLNRYDLAEKLGLDASERTIDVQITRLRKKIEPDPKTPRYLQTVRGKGYVLRV
ncbi:MAG: response regulator [Pseudomonadota bacterium]